MLRAGIEPARPQGTQDFKSCASTYSATPAELHFNDLHMMLLKHCNLGVHIGVHLTSRCRQIILIDGIVSFEHRYGFYAR